MIEVKIIADSIRYSSNDRITTFLVKFPRFIEPELLRHRMFSFSAASSRAISLEKHITSVSEDYFIPAPFTKDCKGMAAKESIEGISEAHAKSIWKRAHTQAIQTALGLKTLAVHKQHASRVLQPFEYTQYLITATEFTNFWNLRCPNYTDEAGVRHYSSCSALKGILNTSSAQPEIQELAEGMFNAYVSSNPVTLGSNVWHIPFGEQIPTTYNYLERLKIASARMARISYLNHEGKNDCNSDIKLADRLIVAGHWSVFEHCARTMSPKDYVDFIQGNVASKFRSGVCNNFTGFIPLRYLLEHEYSI